MSRHTEARPRPLLRPPPRRRPLAWALAGGGGAGLLIGAMIGGSAGPWAGNRPGPEPALPDPPGPLAEVVALREELAVLRKAVAEEADRVARLRSEALSLRREAPAAPAGETPLPAAGVPAARELAPRGAPPREPSPRAAPAEPASPRPPAPATEAAMPRPLPPARAAAPRIVVHYRAGSEAGHAAAQGIAASLRESGLEAAGLRPVEGVPSQRVVRYFHAEDAGAAARLAGQLGRGWAIQDFRTYAPSPSPQLLEVWIPER